MKRRYIFDIETNGLLDKLDTIHSLVMRNADTGAMRSYADQEGYPPIEEGLAVLAEADEIIGHNIVKFDIPAIKKVYPTWSPKEGQVVTDTLTLTRLLWVDIKDTDYGRRRAGSLPGRLIGSHSLEAWGYRLKFWKGDYSEKKKAELIEARPELADKSMKYELNSLVWAHWSTDMQDYCEQDVRVNAAIYRRCVDKQMPTDAVELERGVSDLCAQIERNGFPFNEAGAAELYANLLQKRHDVAASLKGVFGFWYEPDGKDALVDPKRTIRYKDPDRIDRIQGQPWTKIKLVEFNPGSRQHIARCLKKRYGWEPSEFTDDGNPKLDEEVMAGLPYDEAPLLSEYFLLDKRIGQIAEGKQAWLKNTRDGFVFHNINPMGTVTFRGSHSNFNIAQVPGNAAPYGHECRELYGLFDGCPVFGFWPDAVMVGTDMSGLELRCLAHFMGRYDGGDYGRILLGGDIHWANTTALGLVQAETPRYGAEGEENPLHELCRSVAKTWIYAFLYGAGDRKLGLTLLEGAIKEYQLGYGTLIRDTFFGGKLSVTDAMLVKVGKRLRANFLAGLPALGKLTDAVKTKATRDKQLRGLDDRIIPIRHKHAALNTLLQSAGAIICKMWMVELDRRLRSAGHIHGWDGDYAVVAWVHDELQFIARNKEIADEIGRLSKEVAADIGRQLEFRCPLAADFDTGRTWADTH